MILAQFLVICTYILRILFADFTLINSIDTDSFYFVPLVIVAVVLLEHYTSLFMAKKNYELSNSTNKILLVFDIVACVSCVIYILSQPGMQTGVWLESVIIVVFHLLILGCRIVSLFKVQALERILLNLWGGIVALYHVCAVLLIEGLCVVAAFWGEGESGLLGIVWVAASLGIAALVLAEHYLVLRLADDTQISKKAIDIVLAVLDGIIVLISCVWVFLFVNVSIGAFLCFLPMQMLILVRRFLRLRKL